MLVRTLLLGAALACGALAQQQTRYIPRFASSWNVSYIGGPSPYKLVRVNGASGGLWYALTPRGSAPPTASALTGLVPAGEALTHIATPLQHAAFLSSTQINWAELLGVRASVAAVLGAPYISSPCVLRMVSEGATQDVTAADGYSADTAALSGVQAVFCTSGWCPGTPSDVVFPDTQETSLLGIAETGAWGVWWGGWAGGEVCGADVCVCQKASL